MTVLATIIVLTVGITGGYLLCKKLMVERWFEAILVFLLGAIASIGIVLGLFFMVAIISIELI